MEEVGFEWGFLGRARFTVRDGQWGRLRACVHTKVSASIY